MTDLASWQQPLLDLLFETIRNHPRRHAALFVPMDDGSYELASDMKGREAVWHTCLDLAVAAYDYYEEDWFQLLIQRNISIRVEGQGKRVPVQPNIDWLVNGGMGCFVDTQLRM
jgi:hypothetical protein